MECDISCCDMTFFPLKPLILTIVRCPDILMLHILGNFDHLGKCRGMWWVILQIGGELQCNNRLQHSPALFDLILGPILFPPLPLSCICAWCQHCQLGDICVIFMFMINPLPAAAPGKAVFYDVLAFISLLADKIVVNQPLKIQQTDRRWLDRNQNNLRWILYSFVNPNLNSRHKETSFTLTFSPSIKNCQLIFLKERNLHN